MPATRSSLRGSLGRLGVAPGDVIMVHASLRSIGTVTGGANIIVQALLDAVGPTGTIVAYVDFEPFYIDTGDTEVPVFDKRIARAARDHVVLHEVLRTWPGALRSDHPDAGVVALGHLADWITSEHPFQYGYGEGSPFDKALQANVQVLMLGAPLDTITLLHCAEHRAQIPNKRVVRYRRLMPGENGPKWVTFEEFDTAKPVNERLPEDCFERIATAYLASGRGTVGTFGSAHATLLDGRDLVTFGVEWLERYFDRHTIAGG
jgi:aminoglycoside 3-N-acetyltransferase